MWGADDPDDRKPMLWRDLTYERESYRGVRGKLSVKDKNEFDPNLFTHYKKLIKIRHDNPAIQKGNFLTKLTDDKNKIYSFSREYENNKVLVILNNSDRKQTVKIDAIWKSSASWDLLNEKSHPIKNEKIRIRIDKKWGAILKDLKEK